MLHNNPYSKQKADTKRSSSKGPFRKNALFALSSLCFCVHLYARAQLTAIKHCLHLGFY